MNFSVIEFAIVGHCGEGGEKFLLEDFEGDNFLIEKLSYIPCSGICLYVWSFLKFCSLQWNSVQGRYLLELGYCTNSIWNSI